MKIVAVHGSPRPQGNSNTIAQALLDEAASLGAQVSAHQLNQLNYKGCQACYGCKSGSESCVVGDDLQDVLDDAAEADVLVLSTPVYFGEVCAQLKGFIDRTFSWLTDDYLTTDQPSRLAPGKSLVMVLTQANPDQDNFADVYKRYAYFLKMMGFDCHLLRACGVGGDGEVCPPAEVLAQARDLARGLAQQV